MLLPERDGRFDAIRDYARGCFIIDDLAKAATIVANLEADPTYILARAKNRLSAAFDGKASCGYRDYQIILMLPEDKWLVEIQIMPREMYRVKAELAGQSISNGGAEITGHGAYKEYRAIREARQRMGLAAKSATISLLMQGR